MGFVAVVLTVLQEDPGELFGWVQTFLEMAGIWGYVQMYFTLVMVLLAVGAFFKFVGR